MKFSLFAHMERLSPEEDHTTLYENFLSLCQMADEGGMRAIWTGEHHGMEFTIAPNPCYDRLSDKRQVGDGHRQRRLFIRVRTYDAGS